MIIPDDCYLFSRIDEYLNQERPFDDTNLKNQETIIIIIEDKEPSLLEFMYGPLGARLDEYMDQDDPFDTSDLNFEDEE